MASRIKGITVEIGGNTTGLEKALKSVNSTIRTTQSSLKDVNKLLKLDPKNTTLLTQKQKLLKSSIDATKEKLEGLKNAQVQAKQQMENGDLGKDKYDALQREIAETESKLKSLEKESKSFGSVSLTEDRRSRRKGKICRGEDV
jgi:phage-related minor tail protein